MEPKARIRELEGKVAELTALVSRYSAEDAARALEQSALMVNARKIEQDFDRSSVREKLRN
mgnify:CR=1 FL=1